MVIGTHNYTQPDGHYSLLFVADSALGHVTIQLRGFGLMQPLQQKGWDVNLLDVSTHSTEEILATARGKDLVYLLKVSSLDLVQRLKGTGCTLVFDLCDALWSEYHQRHGWNDLDDILRTVDAITSDNPYVAEYGKRFTSNVYVIPGQTHVERFTELRNRLPQKFQYAPLVLGWLGSQGTVGGILFLKNCLEQLATRHPNLELRIVGADQSISPRFHNLPTTFVPAYNEEKMIEEVLKFDIGLFPPSIDVEDYIIRGALKARLYMSAGVPPVCYNAGECADIIEDGITGMLAKGLDEWEEKLEMLITSRELRDKIGKSAQQKMRETHSESILMDKFSTSFRHIIQAKKSADREPVSTNHHEHISVLFVYDIEGWAWWHKIKNIQKFAPVDIKVAMIRMDKPYDHTAYDFIVYFDPYLIGYAANVPPEKLIIGCSCPKYLDQLIEILSLSKCAGGFVNNAEMYHYTVYQFPNLYCCQNGVDETFFSPSPSPPDNQVACWVGNTTSVGQKGLDLIRKSCATTGIPLLTIDREANRDHHQLLSHVQIRDTIYHRASFYICASEVEGTPNPALEALSCGLPVISTRVGNMPEIIRDGYNGFLVQRSSEAIVDAINRLTHLDRHTLSRNARASILQDWTWHQQTEKYIHMFRCLSKQGQNYMTVNRLNRAGTASLEKNDYDGAHKAFANVLALDPHNRVAKYGLILTQKHIGGH